MPKPHPKNERIKRKYLQWLETAKGASTSTADKAAASITAFEKSTKGKDFATFHIEQPIKFKRDLSAAINAKTKKSLAKATIRSRLMDVKAFFKWLADQPGYKSRISHADCEYFNLTANDVRIATARREKPIPTLEQVNHVLSVAPHETVTEMRDRALIAFTLLTGMRDAAIASLPIGKIDVETGEVFQDARDVKTKNAKTMKTFFFPVGGEARQIVTEWIKHLREVELFSEADPLFPIIVTRFSEDGAYANVKLTRDFWQSAASIRRIFKAHFGAADLPYYPPHQIRKTLMKVAFQMKLHPEALKAWSQNLGHDNLATSLNSYGKVNDWRISEIMQELGAETENGQSGIDVQKIDELTKYLTRLKKMS